MKRFAGILLASILLAAAPALAGAERIELLASAAQTASGNGASIDVGGFKELLVTVNVTAGSGTLSAFSVYLETSDDGGSTWYEIAPDWTFEGTGTAGDVTVTLGTKRNIVTKTAIVSSATKWTAAYTKFGEKLRARWLITPTSSPSETFAVKAIGKR